jgi:hypothetical protein
MATPSVPHLGAPLFIRQQALAFDGRVPSASSPSQLPPTCFIGSLRRIGRIQVAGRRIV